MVTMCARDNLQHFLLIMLELCPVPDVVYYAQFSARLICGGLTVSRVNKYKPAIATSAQAISANNYYHS